MHSFLGPHTGLANGVESPAEPVLGFHHARAKFSQSWPIDPDRGFIAPQVAAGRGWTPDDALSSCLGEVVERYSAVYQGNEEIRVAKFREMDNAIHPREILLYSERQYADRNAWNEQQPELVHVYAPFDDEWRAPWVLGECLTGGPAAYIPASCCYFWIPQNLPDAFAVADSNGCGAGRTREEALLPALCELVERDAAGLWWYNRIRRPAAPLASFADERLRNWERDMGNAGWTASLLDLTTEFRVPTYAAVLHHKPSDEYSIGTAAHPDANVAAVKALSEAAQVYCWSLCSPNSNLALWRKKLSAASHPQLRPSGQVTEAVAPATTIDEILLEFRERSLHVYTVDLTRIETAHHAVRAIAPGMRHFWPRFAPGRLYEAPVRLGWIDHAADETSLEPTPLLL